MEENLSSPPAPANRGSKTKPTELAEEKQPTPRPVGELMAQMAYEFQQEEQGWKLLRARDRSGHTDTFIQSPFALYQMKTELRNPFQPVGAGVRLPNPHTEGLPGGRSPSRAQERLFLPRTLELLFEGEPFPFQEIYPRWRHDPEKETLSMDAVVAGGVGAHSPRAADRMRHLISAEQDTLQVKLRREVDKLTRKHDLFKEFG